MTPIRLTALVARALNRTPSALELDIWEQTLRCPRPFQCPTSGCVHDTEADEALRIHTASSTYPATPADVRRIAAGLANTRIDRARAQQRAADATAGVPPTDEYHAARRAFEQAQQARARELDPKPDDQERCRAVRDAARAAIDAQHLMAQEATS